MTHHVPDDDDPREIIAKELGRTPELKEKRDLATRLAAAFRAERVANGFDMMIQRALEAKRP